MSVDVLISPRISFSHDVDLSENNPSVQCEIFPCSSSSIEVDFDFAFSVDRQGALIREYSTAEELFSDGKLLPVSIDFATNTEVASTENPDLFHSSASPVFPCFISKLGSKEDKKILKSLKEHLEDDTDTDTEIEDEESEDKSTTQQATVSRTFWKFRRSSSLNVSNYGRNRGKQSTPPKLKLLSRSKSAGLPRNTVEEDTRPSLPTLMEDERSFWKFKRCNSLDCDKSGQNKGGLIGCMKLILLRNNSTSEQVLAKTATTDESRQFRIRRSSSLNCDGNNRRRRGLIMGRSYSTGSAYSEKNELLKQNSARSSSTSSWKKGQRQGRRRKSFKDYYANFYRGERVNPILNLPSPYISRASVDLLGFGSLFCNGGYRRKKSK